MKAYLVALSAIHPIGIYIVLAVVGMAEGPILAVLCGVLLSAGYLNFYGVYFALMLGDLVGDVLWYCIGYRFGNTFAERFGKYFSITPEHITKVKGIFNRYTDRILVISKLTSGFGFAVVVLFTAGLSKIPFGRYMAINVVGQFIWSAMLIFLGFFFGNLYLQIESVMGRMSFLAFIGVLIALIWGVRNYFRVKLEID